jgi:endonuclease/exonuclease/phosphatase family metal-dependent hydrolase
MSYNIKNGNPTQENTWEVRRPILVRSIAKHEPDVIGTQEGFFFQIKQIVEDLPQYDWIGLGRAGGSKDEMMAILFKQDRFEVMAFDHFWLSDTPEIIGSRTWGHDNRRMVTWVRFKDSASGIEFYHWNTHFDHREQPAREKSATLLLQRLREVMPPAPAVVTGDFNAAPDNPCYATLVAALDGALNLRDTWGIGGERVNDGIGSFNRWEGPQPNGARIDWILATPEFSCTRIEIDTYEEGGQYPSDHFPVIAELVLETGD